MINEIIVGKRGITPETARGLAQALGTSAAFWLNLDVLYQLSRLRKRRGPGRCRLRAKVFMKGPIKEMARRGWIKEPADARALADEVRAFFKLHSLDDEPQFWSHAARKSTTIAK